MSGSVSASQAARKKFLVSTRGRSLGDVTASVAALVRSSGVQSGIAQIFTAHTSYSLLIRENANPAVRRDFEHWFARAVPDGDALLEHDAEGPDDMPAHMCALLAGVSPAVPVTNGRLQLGTWQGIYLGEHRTHAHQRTIVVSTLGC